MEATVTEFLWAFAALPFVMTAANLIWIIRLRRKRRASKGA